MDNMGASITGRRVGAFLVDSFIFSIVFIFPFIAYILSMDDTSHFFLIFYSLYFACILFFALKDVFGRSFGKWLFGLGLINVDDPQQKPTVLRRILRNLTVFIWPVEAIVMLRNIDRRRLGDRLGHTMVVSVGRRKRPMLIGVLVFMLFFSILFLSITQLIRNDGSYKAATEYIRQNDRITDVIGHIESFGAFPSGSLSKSNGHGSADLNIYVHGTKGDLTVQVELTKTPSTDWTVDHISF